MATFERGSDIERALQEIVGAHNHSFTAADGCEYQGAIFEVREGNVRMFLDPSPLDDAVGVEEVEIPISEIDLDTLCFGDVAAGEMRRFRFGAPIAEMPRIPRPRPH